MCSFQSQKNTQHNLTFTQNLINCGIKLPTVSLGPNNFNEIDKAYAESIDQHIPNYFIYAHCIPRVSVTLMLFCKIVYFIKYVFQFHQFQWKNLGPTILREYLIRGNWIAILRSYSHFVSFVLPCATFTERDAILLFNTVLPARIGANMKNYLLFILKIPKSRLRIWNCGEKSRNLQIIVERYHINIRMCLEIFVFDSWDYSIHSGSCSKFFLLHFHWYF